MVVYNCGMVAGNPEQQFSVDDFVIIQENALRVLSSDANNPAIVREALNLASYLPADHTLKLPLIMFAVHKGV